MVSLLVASVILGQSVQGGMDSYIRTIDRTDGISVSQTLAKRLTAPGKPDLWLVGVAHIGLKAYYGEVQKLLDAQGAVLFEGVRSKNTPPPNPNGPKMIYQILGDAMGLDYQLTSIDYNRSNWVNSDIPMEELIKLNKKESNGKSKGFENLSKMLAPDSAESKMLASSLGMMPASVKEAMKIFLVQKLSKVDTMLAAFTDATTLNVLLHDRNQSVESAFDKQLSKSDPPKSIAVFYGAAHQPEIEKDLRAKFGYQYAEQKWLTFATADKKKLDATGKAALQQMMSQFPG